MDRFTFYRMLGEAVYRIDGAYDACSRNAGVKPGLLWMLSALNDGQTHTQSQLCWDWNYPRTTVNTLVKELEKGGYVELHPVPGTRRELFVELTESGKAYADEILQGVYEAEDRLFKLYFQNRSTGFVKELNDFSNAMRQFFSTGRLDDETADKTELENQTIEKEM